MITLPFLFFLFVFLISFKKNGLSPYSFINLLYAFSAFVSILLYYSESFVKNPFFFEKGNITFLSVLSYCSLIHLISYPISKVKSISRIDILSDNLYKKKLFSKLYIILLIAFLFAIYFSIDGLLNLNFENLAETRSEVYIGDTETVKYSGIFHYLRLFVNYTSALWPIAIILFFYFVITSRGLFFKVSSILMSFSGVILNILVAGRTQIVYWFLTFTAIYIVFLPILKNRDKKLINAMYIFLSSIILFYLAQVTLSRWGETGSYDSLLEYIGQPFINYNYFFNNYVNSKIEFGRTFPLTNIMFGNGFDLNDYRLTILIQSGFNIGIFYTFLGDLLVDYGHFGMILFVIILFNVFNIMITKKSNKEIELSHFFLYLVLYLLLIQGLFYYPFWKPSGGFFILICIILFYIFKSKSKVNL